jgi:hypothetical protein
MAHFARFGRFMKPRMVATGFLTGTFLAVAMAPVMADRIGGPKPPAPVSAPVVVPVAPKVEPVAVAASKDYAGKKGGIERTFIAVKPDGSTRLIQEPSVGWLARSSAVLSRKDTNLLQSNHWFHPVNSPRFIMKI